MSKFYSSTTPANPEKLTEKPEKFSNRNSHSKINTKSNNPSKLIKINNLKDDFNEFDSIGQD